MLTCLLSLPALIISFFLVRESVYFYQLLSQPFLNRFFAHFVLTLKFISQNLIRQQVPKLTTFSTPTDRLSVMLSIFNASSSSFKEETLAFLNCWPNWDVGSATFHACIAR